MNTNQESDKRFIIQAGFWPHWPCLPMKKSDEQCGLIMDRNPLGKPIDPNHECFRTIYLVNPWSLGREIKYLKEVEKKTYSTIDEMLMDGWTID